MTRALQGHCHCGAIRVVFEPALAVRDLPLRACSCGFCRRHGARTTSDPGGHLHIEATPGSLSRYRFGRRVVDALLCTECGVYLASSIMADEYRYATLNVAGAGFAAFDGRPGEPADYEDETDEQRLARRLARWTPTVLVEASPSA